MPSLKVESRVMYYPWYWKNDDTKDTPEYLAARDFVKLIKYEGAKYSGTHTAAFGEVLTNQSDAIDHWVSWAAPQVRLMWATDPGREARWSIVPVPSKSMTIHQPDGRTGCAPLAMGRALRDALWPDAAADAGFGTRVLFTRDLSQAHEGGTRDEKVLADAMVVRAPSSGGRVILVDDVVKSGAHLRATVQVLRASGMQVAVAFVAGRTIPPPALPDDDAQVLEPASFWV